MLDMSWGEVMVIGGVALIVIGPKDLPRALRTVGQMTAKVRRLAAEFQTQFSDAMREAELDDVRREMEGINRQVSSATTTAFNPIQTIRDELKTSVEGRTPVATAPVDPNAIEASVVSAPVAASVPLDALAVTALPEPAVVEEAGPIPQIEPAPIPAEPAPVPPAPVQPAPKEPAGPGLEPANDGPVRRQDIPA